MHIPIYRRVGRVALSFLFTTIIFGIAFASVAQAAAVFVAPLHSDIRVTSDGRVEKTDGIRLATIGGNALISPAMPLTMLADTSDDNAVSDAVPTKVLKRRAPVRVNSGTTFVVTSTAYSSTPDQTDASPFITASGTHVHDGTLASNFLPFGTKVTLPDYSGNKVYIVEDRMHPRFSSRADIWFPTRAQALQFGKRTLTLVVVN